MHIRAIFDLLILLLAAYQTGRFLKQRNYMWLFVIAVATILLLVSFIYTYFIDFKVIHNYYINGVKQ